MIAAADTVHRVVDTLQVCAHTQHFAAKADGKIKYVFQIVHNEIPPLKLSLLYNIYKGLTSRSSWRFEGAFCQISKRGAG